MGMIVGTAAYMAPEQARGKTVDRRADIWAFGVVLYEILTGGRLFQGDDVTETLAAVVKEQPDLSVVPVAARRLLKACLEKDPRKRLQAIGDVNFLLEEEPGPIPAKTREGKRAWPAVAAALALASAMLGASLWRATRPAERPFMRLSVDLGPDAFAGSRITAAISPNGRQLVFQTRSASGPQLALRLLDQPAVKGLPGTAGASDPFFSPDGQWIGFAADGKLKKISVSGGAAVTICDAQNLRGASWGEDGNIVAVLDLRTGLSQVPASGGTPRTLTKPTDRGQQSHRWPQFLPGGAAVIFTASTNAGEYEDAEIDALKLQSGEIKTLVRGGYFGRYLSTSGSNGSLVYLHEGVLFGVAFDRNSLEVRGTPAPLVEDVAGDSNSAGGQFDFSAGPPAGPGTLVYLSGKLSGTTYPVFWLDSSGQTQPLAPAAGYLTPTLSPDGKLLAAAIQAGKGLDVHVYDIQRGTLSRLTFTGDGNMHPVWTPGGKHIIYNSGAAGGGAIGWVRADGAGEPQRLVETKSAWPSSFSPDGRLAYSEGSGKNSLDIWTVPVDLSESEHPKAGKPEPFLATPATEAFPVFSRDGRWISYASNESGRVEVYVRPYPGPGGKWQISSEGGNYTFWSRDGRELFYLTLDQHIMVVPFTVKGDSFIADKPHQWADFSARATPAPLQPLDLAPDGKRFAVLAPATAATKGDVHVTFLLNFFDEARRRIPAGR